MNSKPPKKFSDTPPSDLFEDAFRDSVSGCRCTCACGRICFDNVNGGYDWDPGEFEELLKGVIAEPNRYVALDYSVGTMTIDGNEWVMGCPCNGARRFQDFVDGHARQIAEYLNAKAKQLKQDAEAMEVTETPR